MIKKSNLDKRFGIHELLSDFKQLRPFVSILHYNLYITSIVYRKLSLLVLRNLLYSFKYLSILLITVKIFSFIDISILINP